MHCKPVTILFPFLHLFGWLKVIQCFSLPQSSSTCNPLKIRNSFFSRLPAAKRNHEEDSRPLNHQQPSSVDVALNMPGVSEQPSKTRRKKTNKYAKFSKSAAAELDPWETMMKDSLLKRQGIQNEIVAKDRRKAAPREYDPTEIRERNKFEWPDVREIDPYDPTTYGYVELGIISGAHGVKGEVKLIAVTDFADMRLCNPGPRHLRLPNRRSPREIRLISGRRQTGDNYLVVLDGINNREDASKLKGSILYARENERPEVEEDEYYISDLVGAGVFVSVPGSEDDSIHVGAVSGIVLAEEICAIPGIGNDMLELSLPKRENQKQQELVLIPFVPEIVYLVQLSEKRIYVDPPNGLLDLTYIKEEKVRIKGLLPPGPN